MSKNIEQLIIIGSGPASLTAAIYASRAKLHPLIIEGSYPGGQLIGTTTVENWPGNISIMGPQLMMNMKEHAQHFGTRFVSSDAVKVMTNKRPFTITTSDNKEFKAHSIIVATGARAKRLKVPGEDTYWGKGVSTCAVCDGAFFKDKRVLVVGGGDTAMEDALFMAKFTKHITIVHILDKLTASIAMQERVLNTDYINIIYNTTVSEIQGSQGHVTGVTLNNQQTNEQTELSVDAVFVAIGFTPNSCLFEGQIDLDKGGFIKPVNHTQTSVEGIFVAGDVADYRYRQAITAAGAGCMAALDAERWLRKQNIV